MTLLLLAAIACKPSIENGIEGDIDGDDTGAADEGDDTGGADDTALADDTGEPDYSEWDEATLVIVEPASASWLPWGEESDFEAVVYDAEGEATDFDEIAWTSDVDSAWEPVGAAFSDDSLDVGTHAITAVARLPNGDRLAYTVGGVLVQHEDAGTYTGEMNVDIAMEYEGTEYIVSCIGAATLVVDVYGETATGDSSCAVSLMGYDMDANHVFELELADGEVGGEATLDFDWFGYSFDATGEIGDGELDATWEDDVYGYVGVAGELGVTRISRDTSHSPPPAPRVGRNGEE